MVNLLINSKLSGVIGQDDQFEDQFKFRFLTMKVITATTKKKNNTVLNNKSINQSMGQIYQSLFDIGLN